jgi:hypothetical protein
MVRIEDALHYNPETGKLTWLPRGNAKFDNKLAGKEVFTKHSGGYIQLTFNGKSHLAHRVAWLLAHGSWPEHEVDHINGDKTDNRLENLRACTTGENRKNMPCRKNKTSKYTGVRKSGNAWAVLVDSKYRGQFASEDEAGAHAAKLYAELGFHPNHGRTERRAA